MAHTDYPVCPKCNATIIPNRSMCWSCHHVFAPFFGRTPTGGETEQVETGVAMQIEAENRRIWYQAGYKEGQREANEVLTDRLAKAVPPLKVVCNGELVDCPVLEENKRLRKALKDVMKLSERRLGKSVEADTCYKIAEEALKGGGE